MHQGRKVAKAQYFMSRIAVLMLLRLSPAFKWQTSYLNLSIYFFIYLS